MVTTTERGYGAQHQAKRREWAPFVEGRAARAGHVDGQYAAPGHVDCHAVRCLEDEDGKGRRIIPGQAWDLGHTPDRSRWTGPEHARCNRSESMTRTNAAHGWTSKAPAAARRPARVEAPEALAFFE